MKYKLIKYFLSVIILFHCLGLTQAVSAYSKDSSAFVGMMNMGEEETKKEKESKEDADYFNDLNSKVSSTVSSSSFAKKHIYFSTSKNRINYQFIIDSPTPPPDPRS